MPGIPRSLKFFFICYSSPIWQVLTNDRLNVPLHLCTDHGWNITKTEGLVSTQTGGHGLINWIKPEPHTF